VDAVLQSKVLYLSIMEKYIGYVRTSTSKQNLGLEEQQSQISNFIQSVGGILIENVIEQESGKNNQRKGLEYALEKCAKLGYTLLFTKLDRLTREVEFLFAIRNRGVKLRCIELPELNTLTLGIIGTIGQYERELISQRTKNALSELKKTKKLGTPKNLTEEGRRKGIEVRKLNRINNDNWKLAKTFIEHFQMKNGYMNLTEVSKLLNENGYRTRKGCSFSAGIVKRIIDRF
jgi:DNA invertase Pin-like site-specific DNA recombinase